MKFELLFLLLVKLFHVFCEVNEILVLPNNNLTISCNESEVKWFHLMNNKKDHAIVNGSKYVLYFQNGVSILDIVNASEGSVFTAKRNEATICSYKIKYVKQEDFKEEFFINNEILEFDQTNNYHINIEINNPEKFEINYNYRVEAYPLDYLWVNAERVPQEICTPEASSLKCYQTKSNISYKFVKSITLILTFSYNTNLFSVQSNIFSRKKYVFIEVEYAPILFHITEIKVKESENKQLNCTPMFVNLRKVKYFWYSKTQNVILDSNKTNQSTLLYNYHKSTKNVEIICKIMIGSFDGQVTFQIENIENPHLPKENKTYRDELIGVGTVLGVFVVSIALILCFCKCRKKNKKPQDNITIGSQWALIICNAPCCHKLDMPLGKPK